MRIPITKIGGLPPLPLFTNKDAEAAYSLRKLTPSYSGSAVRIRRSSDDSEQDIGFNGLDFDTAGAESFCGAGNGFVTTWYDQSGNGNDATQVTASDQPIIVSSGSILTMGGKPSMYYQDLGNSLVLSTPVTASTLFAVARARAIDTVNYITWNGTDSEGFFLAGEALSITGLGLFEAGSAKFITGKDINRHLGYYRYNGTAYDIAKDGESTTTVGASTEIQVREISRAQQDLANVDMQEMIIFSSDKSSSRTIIESDMNRYYNIF